MATELFPIIATADLQRSLAFYRDLLGGRVTYEFLGADGQPAYVSLALGRSSLGIGVEPAATGGPRPRAIALWVYVDDCDATIASVRASGAEVIAEPALQPWGERVGRVLDPDGNEVVVGSAPA